MPENEQERTRVDRLLTEAERGLEEIQVTVENLSNHLTKEQIEGLKYRLKAILKKIAQAGQDHKSFYEEARAMKIKHEGMIRNEKGQIEKDREIIAGLIEQIKALREEIDKLSAPPRFFGVVHKVNEDGTVDIYTGGRKLQVNLRPGIDIKLLKPGQEVILNETSNITMLGSGEGQGEVVTLEELMEDGRRAKVNTRLDESRIVELSETLRSLPLKVGDLLLFDPRSGYCVEKLPKSETKNFILVETPNVTYDQVGGLKLEIEKLRDAVELPFVYAQKFQDYQLKAPKGILLHGPPGCGKTLLGKALANETAKILARQLGVKSEGRFLYIKGPEILDKYVGETERKIREIFQQARELAKDGFVVVFFDEVDAILRTRGTGISSDVNTTIVPQFLAELDGMETLRNVSIILATNRPDLVDPAVLRPGRVDEKIKIGRPDEEGIGEILQIYAKPNLPLHPKYSDPRHPGFKKEYEAFASDPQKAIDYIIKRSKKRLCAHSKDKEPYQFRNAQGEIEEADNRIMRVIPLGRGGEEFDICLRDLVSGAIIENIVAKAKLIALKRDIAGGEGGVQTLDFCQAIQEVVNQSKELPSTTVSGASEWLLTQGYRLDENVSVRIHDKAKEKPRKVETVTTGQYL